MNKLLKQALLITGQRVDIKYNSKQILEVGMDLAETDSEVITLPADVFVSAGWIDIHTHCYGGFPLYKGIPDEVGIKRGVSTVVDAGTCGYQQIDELYADALNSKTRVFAFINISKRGIETQDELSDLSLLEPEPIRQYFKKYPDFLVGIKARMSKSVIGANGIIPLKIAKAVARDVNKPVMVHIGSAPPELADIFALLERNDIVTHIFNGKANGIIRDQQVAPFVKQTHNRGILFDIGHGSESFSFAVAKLARPTLAFNTISTDIYERNMTTGPVFDLATTMNKFLALGYNKEEVIEKVTSAPAQAINQPYLGSIKAGFAADFTLFKLATPRHHLIDAYGQTMTLSEGFVPVGVIVKGEYYDVST